VCLFFLSHLNIPDTGKLSLFRQKLNTGFHNGIQVNANSHTQTKVDYKGPLDNSSNIQRVTHTHFSDGKSLNATLWLGGGIKKILRDMELLLWFTAC